MATPSSIKIDGKKGKQQVVEERVTKEHVLEQAESMDIPSTPAIEVLPTDRDVEQENQQKLIRDADAVNDISIPQEVSSTLPKAKRARTAANSKRIGAAIAKDEWADHLKKQNEQMELIQKQLSELTRNMQSFRGEAAPGQTQHVAPNKPSFYEPDFTQPETVALRANPSGSHVPMDRLASVTRGGRLDEGSEQVLHAVEKDRRYKRGMEDAPVHFENKGVRERAMLYMNGLGATPTERDSAVASSLAYWNTWG